MDKLYSSLCDCLKGSEQRAPRELESYENATSTTGKVSLKGLQVEDGDSSTITSLAAVPGQQIVCGDGEGKLLAFSYTDGTITKEWVGHSKGVTKVSTQSNIDGMPSRMFTSSRDLSIRMWDINGTASCVQEFKGHHELVISAVMAHPSDRNVICSGSRDNAVALWDVSSGAVINSVTIARNLVTDLCWKGDLLAQTSEDKSLRLWDARNLQVTHTFVKKQQILTSCDVSEGLIVTSSGGFNGGGCEISLWDPRNVSAPVNEIKGHTEKVNKCSFVTGPFDERKYVASVSADRTVRIWNLGTLSEESCCNVGHQLTTLIQLPVDDDSSDLRFGVATHDSGVVIASTDGPSYSHWNIY